MMSERGSATVVMIAVMALMAVLSVGVASIGVLMSARAQAVVAADAAALAAAPATYPASGDAEPWVVAARMAVANGAVLERCICATDPTLGQRTVEVRAAVSTSVPVFGELVIRATARAEFDPAAWLGR
jgi:Flp pilus assembly protein TadG